MRDDAGGGAQHVPVLRRDAEAYEQLGVSSQRTVDGRGLHREVEDEKPQERGVCVGDLAETPVVDRDVERLGEELGPGPERRPHRGAGEAGRVERRPERGHVGGGSRGWGGRGSGLPRPRCFHVLASYGDCLTSTMTRSISSPFGGW